MSLRLWLVRHAQSTWNAERRLQGKADPPLTEEGVRQAERVAQRLIAVEPTVIYTSSLQRAVTTAQIVSEATDVRTIEDPRLQEIGVGVGSGKRWEELTQQWPHLQRIAQRGDLILPHIPGAESLEAFGARVAQSFADIRLAHSEGDVVVVSHGGVFRAYLGQILDVRQGYTPVLHFANASLTQIVFMGPGWIDIQFINSTSHLHNGYRS